MSYTRLFLIRHGQVVNHHEFRYNGHFDVDITDIGLRQIKTLSDFLSNEPVSAIYSSDLQRALKGAEIVGEAFGIQPVSMHDFRELSLGRWEGLTREEGAKRFPEEAGFRFRDLADSKVEGGESLHDLHNRVMPKLNELLNRHRNEALCLVAHGGVNRVILCDAMGLPMENFFRIEQDFGCLNVIDYFEDGVKVVKLLNGGPNQELKKTKIY